MKREIGMRVGAVSHSEGETIYIFGYGIYEGDTVPAATVGGFMGKMLHEAGVTNPTIKLDSGKIVYGCECWWGDEAEVRARVAKFASVVEVDIDESRAKVAAVSEEPEVTAEAVPEDSEMIQVVQNIEGEFPDLEPIKRDIAVILARYVAAPSILPLAQDLLLELSAMVLEKKIKGVSLFSLDVLDSELEVNLGILFSDEKEATITFVMKVNSEKVAPVENAGN